MATRTLDSSPRILPLYARVAAPLIPGASLLPFVPGGGKEIPQTELVIEAVETRPEEVAAYARVCGFQLRGTLPPTYPHVLAFPLHMALMADGSFPFGAIGLVHLSNRIEQRRPIQVGEPLGVSVRATPLEAHPKGRTFSILTSVRAGGETVWKGRSTMLRRGGGSGGGSGGGGGEAAPPQGNVEWKLPGDLGRRYAAVSGDRNPIHLHPLTSKPLGFPRPIAHGMWTKARCLAALDGRLPGSFAVDVSFRKPIPLPGRVRFGSESDGERIRFAVRHPKKDSVHLLGSVEPASNDISGKE